MTDQPSSAQESAMTQLKQKAKDRLNQGVGLATTATGQQAGSVAQAVRQAGEEMRQQGQESHGQVADRVAQPLQRLSGNLSQVDPEQLTGDLKQVKPKLGQQAQQLKAKAGEQIKQQTDTRSTQAGEAVTTIAQGARQSGQQLRAQGQEVPALVLDVLVEKVEPLGTYLVTADADQLRSDLARYGRQVKTKLSRATGAVTRKQEAAATKGSQVAKQTAAGVRQKPVMAIVGAVVGVALAARQGVKAGQSPAPDAQPDDKAGAEGVSDEDLQQLHTSLSSSERRQPSEPAGAQTDPTTK